ncbi:hypothetical protein GCM10009634_36200 [Saccharothrix xinjiangensis]
MTACATAGDEEPITVATTPAATRRAAVDAALTRYLMAGSHPSISSDGGFDTTGARGGDAPEDLLARPNGAQRSLERSHSTSRQIGRCAAPTDPDRREAKR